LFILFFVQIVIQGLNQALLILLPKRPDVAALSDYRPISLIHIFSKLVAKTLATRLPPDGVAGGWKSMHFPQEVLHP
jgi:hypothetical protein